MGANQARAAERRVRELEQQVSYSKSEALSTKANLATVKREVEVLKKQLLACQKVQDGMEMKLQKAMGFEKQLASAKADAVSTNNSLKSSRREIEQQLSSSRSQALSTKTNLEAVKKEVEVLKKQLSACQKVQDGMEMKLQKAMGFEKQLALAKADALSTSNSFKSSRKEIEQQLSSSRSQVSSTKANLETVKREVDVLNKQISAYQKVQDGIGMKLKKALEFEKQLASTKADAVSTKNSSRALRKEVDELREQLSTREKIQPDIVMKLHRMMELERQVNFSEVEALLTKNNLEASRKDVEDLKEQLSGCEKFHENMELKLQKIMELEKQLSSIATEVFPTKATLEASRKDELVLGEQLGACETFQQDMETKLQYIIELEKQLSCTKADALFSKAGFKASQEKEEELKEQLLSCEKFHQDMEMKLRKVMELEKQLSYTNVEALSAKTRLIAAKSQENLLHEQLTAHEEFEQNMEMKLQKVIELEKLVSSTSAETSSTEATLETTRKEVEDLKEMLLTREEVQQAVVEPRLLCC